jgi:hypothetical protein
MNFPSEIASTFTEIQIINTDICYDITNTFSSFSGIPGITITPPVTTSLVSTATSQIVSDCFATNADSIFDLFTEESWIRGEDDNFVKNSF